MRHELLSAPTVGGFVVGMSADKKQIYFNGEDTHTLTIGSTRSGKSRTVVLPTVCLLALAGESIIATDPKAELYCYTAPFLERLGYEVITIDFKNPLRSSRYNFLQPVVDAVNEGNLPLAVTRARDVASMLVPDGANQRTEPIWLDGQRSALTTGILAVVIENRARPEYQNMSNAYQFIAKMFKPIGKNEELPIVRYLETLPTDHPVNTALDIAEIAPSKMRGSFYTSALTSLTLFSDPFIHTMTAATDFDCYATGRKKRAIFIILPDYKSTYYPLAALFVYQQYQMLAEESDKCGNRLPLRVNFLCDEFGNFVRIPDFDKFITVGGGRGIRFNLFVQDMNQIDEKYGDKLGKTIRANCETWIYLHTNDEATRQEFSSKLGKYTIKSPSLSGSSGGNSSASYNYTGRELLTAEEISRVNRPYQLVITRYGPAVLYAPDLSETVFNKMLGLGGVEHNKEVILRRTARRPELAVDVRYWGVWDLYIRMLKATGGN